MVEEGESPTSGGSKPPPELLPAPTCRSLLKPIWHLDVAIISAITNVTLKAMQTKAEQSETIRRKGSVWGHRQLLPSDLGLVGWRTKPLSDGAQTYVSMTVPDGMVIGLYGVAVWYGEPRLRELVIAVGFVGFDLRSYYTFNLEHLYAADPSLVLGIRDTQAQEECAEDEQTQSERRYAATDGLITPPTTGMLLSPLVFGEGVKLDISVSPVVPCPDKCATLVLEGAVLQPEKDILLMHGVQQQEEYKEAKDD